ncbi:hypothetical protein AAG906_020744 [Vitis piasezkii]
MFPPADDPHDLGIPPNRGPLSVRRNPNSKPNPRVRLSFVFFHFYCFVSYLYLAFYRENLTSFPRKSPTTGSHPTAALCPSGETLTLNLTLVFVLAIDAMLSHRGFGGSELTETLYKLSLPINVGSSSWSLLDFIDWLG